jgi:hypothetical protein
VHGAFTSFDAREISDCLPDVKYAPKGIEDVESRGQRLRYGTQYGRIIACTKGHERAS